MCSPTCYTHSRALMITEFDYQKRAFWMSLTFISNIVCSPTNLNILSMIDTTTLWQLTHFSRNLIRPNEQSRTWTALLFLLCASLPEWFSKVSLFFETKTGFRLYKILFSFGKLCNTVASILFWSEWNSDELCYEDRIFSKVWQKNIRFLHFLGTFNKFHLPILEEMSHIFVILIFIRLNHKHVYESFP